MPTHYAIVTKFTSTTQDFLCAALNIGSGGPINIPYTLFRFGTAPIPGTMQTNTRGFARTQLPAGTTDALVKVDMPLTGAVSVEQFQTSGGTGVLYVAYPPEAQSLGKGFEVTRVSGSEFILIGNKWSVANTVTVFSRGGVTNVITVQPLTVSRLTLATADTYVTVSADLAILLQTSVGTGFPSTLAPHL
jgi:hypothetical protein